MKRLLIFITIFGFFGVLPIRSAYAKNILVDDDRVECKKADVTSIQSAVNLASAGDNIIICPGTYAGGVVVDKAGLKISAKGSLGSAKVIGTGAAGPLFGLTITANNVLIDRLEISGFSGKHDASGIFVGGLFAGDTAHPADGAVIQRNNIHDNGNGIYLWQSNNNQIQRNEVHNNKDVDGDEGTGISSFNGFGDVQTLAANAAGRSGKNNDISRNDVHDNDRLGIFAGACTEAAYGCTGPTGVHADISGTVIDRNEVYNNGVNDTEGIGLLDASGGLITRNNIYSNKYHGILINFSNDTMVERNNANNNSTAQSGYAGIRLNNAININVTRNATDRNGRGISVTKSNNSSFIRNSAQNNSDLDFNWDNAGVMTFQRNSCGTALPSKTAWDCR